MWPERFTLGLASFLLGALLLPGGLRSGARHGRHGRGRGSSASALVAAVLLAVLWPHLGRVRGPVLVYVGVIARDGMCRGAPRARAPDDARPSGALALAGALVFMASDGVLAVDRFAHRFTAAHAVVMVTYYTAQTLIAASVAAFS